MYTLKKLNKILKQYNKQLYVKKTSQYMAHVFLKRAYHDSFYGGLSPKLTASNGKDIIWTEFVMDIPVMALSSKGCYDKYRPAHELKPHLKHRNFHEILSNLKRMQII